MNIEAVREKIANKLLGVSEITTGIYRGLRRQGEQDFAAYVFDLNGKLPRTVGHLSNYLNEVLGQSYFSETEAPDLRWNNYLYFVVKDEDTQEPEFNTIKQIVEADRSYARKYVVLEDDFERVLNELDSIAVVDGASQTTDVLQVWSEKLSANGLDDVLDETRTVSDIVREISTGSSKNTTRSRRVSGVQESKQLISSRLESVNLGGFRQYPKRTTFDKLGKANLIFGANGAGKTSFMEGLEFLFCGANRRSSAPPLATVNGRLQSGFDVSTSDVQPMSDFKTRQRLWYGSDDTSRNNNLPNQFSRFNFLNTDAAAELSLIKDTKAGQKNNSETLADLLSGHEATEVWKRIQSLEKSIISEGREKRAVFDIAKTEKEAKAEILKKLEDMPGQAAASFSIFIKDLQRLGWRAIPLNEQSLAGEMENTLSELGSQLAVVRQLSWMENDINKASISENVDTFIPALRELKEELSQIRASERTAKLLAEKQSEALARRDALSAISQDAIEDLVQLTKGMKEATDELILHAKTFSAVFVVAPPDDWQSKYGPQLVNDAHEQCVNEENKLKEEVSGKEKQLADLTSTQTQLQNAITEVHDWARKVIEHRHSDKNCPVCNTEFSPGELLYRMSEQVSAPIELVSADLKRKITEVKHKMLEVVDERRWLSALLNFTDSTPDGISLTVLEAQPIAVRMHGRLYDLRAIRQQNQSRIDDYARTGLTLQEVEKLCLPLDGREHPDLDLFNIGEATLRIETHMQELESEKSKIDKKKSVQNAEVNRILQILSIDSQQPITAVEEIAQVRLDQLRRATAACNELSLHLDLRPMTNLPTLYGSIEAAVLSAKSVISLIEQEAKADTEKNAIKEKLNNLNTQIKESEEAIGRLRKAAVVLKDIVENHSLDAATEAVVAATHTVADSIFSRIHTPAEYRVNSTFQSPLTRRDNDEAVQLNEVSTGQRAAYALSMFLAMNAQVKDGPKVMLLDDPISHIDDLNALSFLDYLRNVVLKSDRQLFFATADEKIAGLFVHKFGFLGDDFQIIELERNYS